MSQENYTIIPLMGVDQSGAAITPTPSTITIGLSANPVATTNGATINLTVPTPSNFYVGQTITVAGGVGTIATVTAANYNITAVVTAVGTTTISYNGAANGNAVATGGGTAMTVAVTFTPTAFNPLERLPCSDGTVRMLVKGTVATINANDAVIVDASGNARQATTALLTQAQVTAGWTIGFASSAITYSATTPNYGWIIVNGPCQVNVAGATAVGTALFSSTTAGQLATSGNGGANPYLILGIMATTSTAGAGTVNAIATNPTVGQTAAGTL